MKNSLKADAHVLNLSVAVIQSSPKTEQGLQEIVDYAARKRPMYLDAGTNNEQYLHNPLYLGMRKTRPATEDLYSLSTSSQSGNYS